MFSETRVVAFRYLSGFKVLDRTKDTSGLSDSGPLVDGQNDTCLAAMTKTGQTLRVAFEFPGASISHEMSVEVLVMNHSECTDLMWTWWVYMSMYDSRMKINSTYFQSNAPVWYSYILYALRCYLQCQYTYMSYVLPYTYPDETCLTWKCHDIRQMMISFGILSTIQWNDASNQPRDSKHPQTRSTLCYLNSLWLRPNVYMWFQVHGIYLYTRALSTLWECGPLADRRSQRLSADMRMRHQVWLSLSQVRTPAI